MKLSEFRKKIEETIVEILNEAPEVDPIKTATDAVKKADEADKIAQTSMKANPTEASKKAADAASAQKDASKKALEAAQAKKKENPTGTQPNQKP